MVDLSDIPEVAPEGPPWKRKNEGIPPSWTGKGAGGNADVWLHGNLAIKRLRANASDEPVARFIREARLLREFEGKSNLAVVQVKEFRRRFNQLEMVMEAYEGNLGDVIDEFAGEPAKAAAALVPIVETLSQLANRPNPVHHRDIKPENLLYRRIDGRLVLALADFGCAYLAEDERLTPHHRAIGAWAFRPPEYCTGRVECVDEKGDVFGLGKVFWAMVNGERKVVFPGPVWFLEEFDLSRRFPGRQKIHHAMIAIARACDIRPERRPTLVQLSDELRRLMTDPSPDLPDSEKTAAMLRAEALREAAYQQRRPFAAQFIAAIHADFTSAVERLHAEVPNSAVFATWHSELKTRVVPVPALVSQTADQESDAPLLNVAFRRTELNTRFFPSDAGSPIRFQIRLIDQNLRQDIAVLRVQGAETGFVMYHRYGDQQDMSASYEATSIYAFLLEGATHFPS